MKVIFMGVDYHLLKRKRKSGSVYYAGFLADNGKTYKLMKSTKQTNKKAAERVVNQWIAEGTIFATREGLEEYLLNFWDYDNSEYIKGKKAEGKSISRMYCQNNIQRIKDYFLPYFKEQKISKLADLNKKNLMAWRNWLFSQNVTSPATQNKVRQAVQVALNYAVLIDDIPFNPLAIIPTVKAEPKHRKIFEVKELIELFKDSNKWNDLRCYTACLISATTGARLGEVRGLQLKNIHLKKQYIDIVTNFVSYDGLKKPKWESARLGVPLPSIACKAVSDLLQQHPFADNEDAFLIFTTYSIKQPFDGNAINKDLNKSMQKLGITGGRSFHSFRHTYVSHLSNKLPSSKVSLLVGHTSAKTTAGYNHQTDQDREEYKNAVSSLLPMP